MLFEERTIKVRFSALSPALNCSFYAEDEIEFDLDPRDVSSEDEFLRVMDFMRLIGKRLAKDVLLTEENAHDFVLIQYRHEHDDIVPGASLNTRFPGREPTSAEAENFFKAVRNQDRP